MSLQIEISRIEYELVLVKLSGKLTRWEERFIDERFMFDLFNRADQNLIVDLFGVHQIDSSGLHLLYKLFAGVRKAGGDIRFVGANARIFRLLHITRLDTLLKVYPSMACPAEALSPAAQADLARECTA